MSESKFQFESGTVAWTVKLRIWVAYRFVVGACGAGDAGDDFGGVVGAKAPGIRVRVGSVQPGVNPGVDGTGRNVLFQRSLRPRLLMNYEIFFTALHSPRNRIYNCQIFSEFSKVSVCPIISRPSHYVKPLQYVPEYEKFSLIWTSQISLYF